MEELQYAEDWHTSARDTQQKRKLWDPLMVLKDMNEKTGQKMERTFARDTKHSKSCTSALSH